MDYENCLNSIKSKKTSKDDITLEPVKKALEELGRQEKDCEVVLVGGTNGKGSTVEMISEMLQYLGNNVGISKSPHLVSARERVQFNGENISKKRFVDLYERITSTEQELSFFEFMVVMAYLYFSEEDADYAVMEVGMGGKLDATNAAEPELSVITNVEVEHKSFLGDSRGEIASEIAGITPENGKIVTGEDLESIKKVAEQKGSKIARPVDLEKNEDHYSFEGQRVKLPIEGSFQKQNMESALSVVRELERIPEDIGKAISGLECPGRMEKVAEKPKVILDGAHNPAAVEKLIEDLPEDFVCVFNATKKKDYGKMIQILEEKTSKFVFTESGVDWCENAEKLAEKASVRSEVEKDPILAVEKAEKEGKPVVLTGSLYLIGTLKESKKWQKPKLKTFS